MARYINIRETASTNTYLARMAAMLPSGTVIYTHHQSAGRGQRGNSWEAEPGKNLTFSLLMKNPAVAPAAQFYISEAVSLAIVYFLSQYVPDITVKWPNDIYYRDSKICGILIEHSLCGNSINHTIAGIGININQTEFLSDAPNPISLKLITGNDVGLDGALRDVCSRIEQGIASLGSCDLTALHSRYLSVLYRNDGQLHEFASPSGERFRAKIADVLPTGMLVLEHEDGATWQYAFKEVSFVI